MAEERHEKLAVARIQLEQALRLYLEGEDYFSPATLAGAAEEILGRMVKRDGTSTALDDRTEGGMRIHRRLFGKETSSKRIHAVANRVRNELKHHDSAAEGQFLVCDPKAECEKLLDRAVDNYFKLTGDLTPPMLEYQNKVYPGK